MRFQEKVAIVTGGGSGMGKEVATRFVAEGGSVVVNISAIDSQDVKRFFHSNGSLLVAALNKATRNGSLLRTV